MASSSECEAVLSKLLVGAQFDSFRVHGLIVYLGFVRPDSPASLPSESWLMVSGALQVEASGDRSGCEVLDRKFAERRATSLGLLYLLIGNHVSKVRVGEGVVLEVEMHGGVVRAGPDGETELEEIWAVMDDSPRSDSAHLWYVALDDNGQLSVRVPA